MSELKNEYEIQKLMAKSLKTVDVRLWGYWNGADTRPRWRCNKHLNHEFHETVESVQAREQEHGTGCPYCARLMERPVVPFEVFSKDAVEVNGRLKKQMDKSLAKARRASFNRLQAS